MNNTRLQKSGVDNCGPTPLFSGDTVQFGVDVVENQTGKNKVTHGCIMGTVKLFLPNGKEAKSS